ncbi:BN860_05952g1_1 [Zygosaccharomyces bailii CLIB 213]|uniref:BN860_05952g1_1 n=1 Tax=Zygosaccharomyces bailii (strain CLIB 213 / ATCC 58445 / CBS 680 / BCRC 21525 / NBRC 1098 / NCYC 1416 / NRRL Y-2227) TaxID=1333698 RepID=A0A8J2T105_ZYGB2|nr:BN860_05952g1_1 [Zygosaccharomyces bailii CLIB 213]
MKRDALNQLGIVVGIVLLFFLGEAGIRSIGRESEDGYYVRPSQVRRYINEDASLHIPFLDKLSKFWYVEGRPEIRNADYVRLTKVGAPVEHGVVVSNGVGDNTINDFEIVVKFRITPKNKHAKKAGRGPTWMGDGMAIVITPEKDFVNPSRYVSRYAKKQFDINSGGVLLGNTEMMGFPRNLPGLNLVIDTFQNSKSSRAMIPFLDIMINTSPREQYYDAATDGAASTAMKLTQTPIRLKRSVVQGDVTEIRIIYMESINTVKVDVKYAQEGDYWIELYQSRLPVPVPKNRRTGQRYIGIGGLTGELTQTVDVLSVDTSEFHLKDQDESSEDTYDYAKEVQLFLAQEFKQKVSLEEDEFQRWKIMKAQPNFASSDTSPASRPRKPRSLLRGGFCWLGKMMALGILIIALYLASVYIRVSAKHISKTQRRRRAQSMGLLPM